jgi:myo-inositol-1(or 4)-monophosphatase
MAGVGRVTVSLRRSTAGGTGTGGGAVPGWVAGISGTVPSAAVAVSPSPPPDPADLVALATDVAERAVRLLRDGRRAGLLVETKVSPTDMVSEMDRASERMIVADLLAERPDDGIVGEEGSERAGTSGLRWVIDPLDGTTNYLYDHPGWAVSIAAEDATGVVAGVVADAVHGETFTATRGGGAFRDGAPISCSTVTALSTALIGTGFGYRPERRRAQGAVIAALLPVVRDIRRMGAASVDLCSVACGRLDAYFERGLAWWDLAAGALVAREAGAVVSAIDGGPVEPGSVLAAGPGLATSFRDLLCSLGAQEGP